MRFKQWFLEDGLFGVPDKMDNGLHKQQFYKKPDKSSPFADKLFGVNSTNNTKGKINGKNQRR